MSYSGALGYPAPAAPHVHVNPEAAGGGGYLPGATYPFVNASSGNSPLNFPANVIGFLPFVLHSDVKIAAMGVVVSGTSGTNKIRLGIYDAKGRAAAPDRLLVDAGEISTTTSGTKTLTLPAVAALPSGLYWYAFWSDTAQSGGGYYTRTATYPAYLTSTDIVVPRGLNATFAGGSFPGSLSGLAVGNYDGYGPYWVTFTVEGALQ